MKDFKGALALLFLFSFWGGETRASNYLTNDLDCAIRAGNPGRVFPEKRYLTGKIPVQDKAWREVISGSKEIEYELTRIVYGAPGEKGAKAWHLSKVKRKLFKRFSLEPVALLLDELPAGKPDGFPDTLFLNWGTEGTISRGFEKIRLEAEDWMLTRDGYVEEGECDAWKAPISRLLRTARIETGWEPSEITFEQEAKARKVWNTFLDEVIDGILRSPKIFGKAAAHALPLATKRILKAPTKLGMMLGQLAGKYYHCEQQNKSAVNRFLGQSGMSQLEVWSYVHYACTILSMNQTRKSLSKKGPTLLQAWDRFSMLPAEKQQEYITREALAIGVELLILRGMGQAIQKTNLFSRSASTGEKASRWTKLTLTAGKGTANVSPATQGGLKLSVLAVKASYAHSLFRRYQRTKEAMIDYAEGREDEDDDIPPFLK